MSYVVETRVKKGHLELNDVPFSDDIDVKVIIIPKVDLSKMSFLKARKLTRSIKGNLADDVEDERKER